MDYGLETSFLNLKKKKKKTVQTSHSEVLCDHIAKLLFKEDDVLQEQQPQFMSQMGIPTTKIQNVLRSLVASVRVW